MALADKWPMRLWRSTSGPIISSDFTMATNRLLGRDTAGAGSIEELALGNGLQISSGELRLDPIGYIPVAYGKVSTGNIIANATVGLSSLSNGSRNDSANTTTFRMNFTGIPALTSSNYVLMLSSFTWSGWNTGAVFAGQPNFIDSNTIELNMLYNGNERDALSWEQDANFMFVLYVKP